MRTRVSNGGAAGAVATAEAAGASAAATAATTEEATSSATTKAAGAYFPIRLSIYFSNRPSVQLSYGCPFHV